MKWALGLGAAWLAAITISGVRANLPASWWLVPGDLIVEDTPQGTCPTMHYSRTIRRSFHGEWTVTLRRQLPGGGFAVARVFQGSGDYRPDSVLPDVLTFDWWAWLEPGDCDWPPGVYDVLTSWEIEPGGPSRFARVQSNPFEVLP